MYLALYGAVMALSVIIKLKVPSNLPSQDQESIMLVFRGLILRTNHYHEWFNLDIDYPVFQG